MMMIQTNETETWLGLIQTVTLLSLLFGLSSQTDGHCDWQWELLFLNVKEHQRLYVLFRNAVLFDCFGIFTFWFHKVSTMFLCSWQNENGSFCSVRYFCTFYYSCTLERFCIQSVQMNPRSQLNTLLFKHLWEVAEPRLANL